MATFNLKKGNKFEISKGIRKIQVGLGWNPAVAEGVQFDVDAHAFGLSSGRFYNDASHALTYANTSLKRDGKAFITEDKSMRHSGDDRNGKAPGIDEAIDIDFDLLPEAIDEISIFITIYEAKTRKQNFGMVEDAFAIVKDVSGGVDLCKYALTSEFVDAITVQVGSMVKNDGKWSFAAVGAGTSSDELGEVLERLG